MEYTLILNDKDLQILSASLGELPFKIVAPLVEKINKQIENQRVAEKK